MANIIYRCSQFFSEVLSTLFHHHPMVVFECRLKYKRKRIHPCFGRLDVPLAFYEGDTIFYIELPDAFAFQFTRCFTKKELMLYAFLQKYVERKFITSGTSKGISANAAHAKFIAGF